MEHQEKSQAEIDFATIAGLIFSTSTTIEYLVAANAMFKERKANYISNKCRDAEKSCQTLYDKLLAEVLRRLSPEEQKVFLAGIEKHKDMVYGFFLLDEKDMERVYSLTKKIRKEKLK